MLGKIYPRTDTMGSKIEATAQPRSRKRLRDKTRKRGNPILSA
jgi:hypothetical protein